MSQTKGICNKLDDGRVEVGELPIRQRLCQTLAMANDESDEQTSESREKAPPAKKVDVIGKAYELASYMKTAPELIEKDLVQAGEGLIAIYEDANFGLSFKNMKDLRREAIEMAIQDISAGVMSLRSSTIGVSFRGNKLVTFVTPHGSSPQGTVAYSIAWKNIKAFQNWRETGEEDVTQDEINLAIYLLTVHLSKLVQAS